MNANLKTFVVGMVLTVAAPAFAEHTPMEDRELVVIKAAPGRETIKPMKADWCGDYVRKGRFNEGLVEDPYERVRAAVQNHDDDRRVLTTTHFEDYQQGVAVAACEWPDDAKLQQQVAYWRQLEVNVTGLSEAEDRQTLKVLVNVKKAEDLQNELQTKYKTWPQQAPDEATRALRRATQALLFGSNTLKTDANDRNLEYFIDTPGRPVSAIERSVYTWICLIKPDVARCGADARRLDPKAVDEETRALGLNPLGQMRAHVYTVAAKTEYERALAALMKLDAQAPTFNNKKYAVDHAEAAYVQWEKEFYPAHKADYDRINALETIYWTPSGENERRSALTGGSIKECGFVRELYLAAAAAMQPKSQKDFDDRLGADPWLAYLREHTALCDTSERRPLDAWAWLHMMSDGVAGAARGPRAAMYAANRLDTLEQAAAGITSVRMGQPTDALRVELWSTVDGGAIEYPRDWQVCTVSSCKDSDGRVATAKSDPSGAVLLTFKSEKVWEREMICKPSNKVRRFMTDGKPEFEPDCHAGKWYQVTTQQRPLLVPKVDATVIKPGMYVRFVTSSERGNEARPGIWAFPLEIKQPAAAQGKEDKLLFYGLTPIRK